jgi:hypothetical protein
MVRNAEFSELQGKTIQKVLGLRDYSEEVTFYMTNGQVFRMAHYQD